jgi:hypothetical protein
MNAVSSDSRSACSSDHASCGCMIGVKEYSVTGVNGEFGVKGMEASSVSSVTSCSCGTGWGDALLVFMFNVNRERPG